MPRYFLFILISFISHSLQAQILNVEKSRLDRDTSKTFIGSAGMSLQMFNRSPVEDTANNFFGFNSNADIAYLSPLHSYMLLNSLNYIALHREPIVSTGYSHLRINFMRKQRFSYEAFGQYQYDQVRGLRSRFLAGTGLRTRIIKTKRTSLFIGNGAMFERELWRHPDTDEIMPPILFIKSTNYLSYRIAINENLDLNAINYYQVAHDDHIGRFRHRLSGNFNLLVKLTTRLNFKSSFNYAYENLPVVPINPFVYSLTSGVQLGF